MRTVEPSYEILAIPEGEQALALLERIGRVAYKSEDKIDSGWDWCERCDGLGFIDVKKGVDEITEDCPECGGTRGAQVREPSSHKFVRMILKAERKAKLVEMLKAAYQETWRDEEATTLAHDDLRELLADKTVRLVLEYMEQNPAHESVIEHCSATVLFTGNRGFTHELVRHRLAAFTQESTRYCNYAKGKFGSDITVSPDRRPLLAELDNGKTAIDAATHWKAAVDEVSFRYIEMVRAGIPPQVARDVLPQVLKADIVMTANFREWRHIFRMRDSKAAHPDMQQLMRPLHEEFRKLIPIIFD